MKDVERLDAYLSGETPDADAAAFEDDLFVRAATGEAPELAFVDGLAAAVRDLVRRGTYHLYLTAAEVERLRASGANVQVIDILATPEKQEYALARDVDFLVARYPIDLRGVRSLDVEVYLGDRLSKVMKDVRFDPADGAAYFCCEGDLARQTVGFPTRSKFFATTDAGERRLVAELDTLGVLAP
jgi:hypothetical protein